MIDARGLSCPQPVLLIQREIKKKKPQTAQIVVDNEAAVQNITRFAASCGYTIQKELQDGDTVLTLNK